MGMRGGMKYGALAGINSMAEAVTAQSQSKTRTGRRYLRSPLPAGHPPERTRSHPGARALHRARSLFREPSETLPASRGPPELGARVFPGIQGLRPISCG